MAFIVILFSAINLVTTNEVSTEVDFMPINDTLSDEKLLRIFLD